MRHLLYDKWNFLFVIAFTLFFYSIIQHSFAFERIAILEISTSGRSVIIDKGASEGVQVGDIARFIIQSGNLSTPKLEDLAYAEAVRVNSNYSFWLLLKNSMSLELNKNEQILFAPVREVMRGRSKFRTLYRQILGPNKTTGRVRKEQLTGEQLVPEDMIHKDEDYSPGKKLVESKMEQSHNLEVLDFAEWEKSKGTQYLEEYDEDLKYVDIKDLEEAIDYQYYGRPEETKIYNSTLDGSLNKINEQEGGLDELYEEQKREEEANMFQSGITVMSTYEEYHYNKKLSNVIHPRIINKVKSGGKFWSGDMSEEQLRRYFIKSGLEEETNNQWLALENKKSHEITLKFSLGLARNTDTSDPDFQSTSKFFHFSYNLHLMKISPILKSWSYELGYGGGNGYYDFGDINLKSKDIGFSNVLNFYFYRTPSAVKRIMGYCGLGLRSATSVLASIGISQQYNYQYFAPLFQIGLKYRFSGGDEKQNISGVGTGAIAQVSAERITLSATEDLFDDIDGKVQVTDVKLTLGMSVYF